ncbi:MAG TPA: sigma-70 family RNA polymerase sigma factor [Candidatus Udaeobacter sp.]|nr:sigma-70 family RNA polymerase sigma factor [Candidatus Udaeobacter sp.]
MFSILYMVELGGDWPAIPPSVMCSASLCMDGVTRSALLKEARKGDRESLARLIVPYSPGVYLGALRLTGNPADAEDVRQEAFLKAMSRLDQFVGAQEESRDDLHAWVSRIASNAAIDVIRKRRDGKLFSLEQPTGANEETLGSNVAASGHNPEERLARREMRKLMSEAIAQLPPDLRRACLLRDVLQYSTQEVADRLGVSAMAVRLRLFRAHRRLREKLSDISRTRKDRQACVAARERITRRGTEQKREPAISFGAYAGYACGD